MSENFKQQRPYEQENYPVSPEIIYYGDRKFNYKVIQEGVYLQISQMQHTEAPNYFPIPENCRTIQCSIYYIEGNPHYLICFGNNLQYQVVSAQSPFDASVELHKVSFNLKLYFCYFKKKLQRRFFNTYIIFY